MSHRAHPRCFDACRQGEFSLFRKLKAERFISARSVEADAHPAHQHGCYKPQAIWLTMEPIVGAMAK